MNKTIIYGILVILCIGLVSAVVPSMNLAKVNTTVSDVVAYTNDTLVGYCNASDGDTDNVQYPSRWYLNTAMNATDYNYPEGKYIDNFSLHVENAYPRGITMNGSHIFVVDYTDDMIYKYDLDGTYLSNCTLPFVEPTGITMNGTGFFVADPNAEDVFGLDFSCAYTGFNFSVGDTVRYLAITDNYFYVEAGSVTQGIVRFLLDGTGATNVVAGNISFSPQSVEASDSFLWIEEDNDIMKYKADGNYTGFYWNISTTSPEGIVTNNSYFWIADNTNDVVLRYYHALPQAQLTKVDNNISSGLSIGQNWTFSCLASDIGGSNSSWLNSSILTVGLPTYSFVNPVAYLNQTTNEDLNVTKHGWVTNVDATLYYNGTQINDTDKTNYSGYFFFNTSLVPQATGSVGFYWEINVSYIDNSSYVFFLPGNQTVFDWGLDNCSTYNFTTINMTIYDEESPTTDLDADVEVDLIYWINNPDTYNTYSTEYSGSHTYTLCLWNENDTIYVDAYIKYTTSNGFTHRYYLVNRSLSNDTLFLSMYNLNRTAGVSDLKLTIRRQSDYSYYTNIVSKLQRRYPAEGVWRTVQMDESGDFGNVFYNIIEESVDYKLLFYDRSNNLLRTTEQMKFICTSGVCELTVLLDPYSATITTSELSVNVSFNNDTGNITLDWTDPLAGSNDVRFIVRRDTMTGAYYVCNTSQSGASGNTICDVSSYTGAVFVSVEDDGEILQSEWINVAPQGLGVVIDNLEGAVWAFGIILTVAMFGMFSPVGGVISTIIGLIMVYFLGIFSPITVTFVIIACVIGVVIGLILKK